MKRLLCLLASLGSFPVFAIADFIADTPQGFFRYSTPDNRYQLQLDGRIYLDLGAVSSETNPGFVANNDFRRMRLSFKSSFDEVWGAEFDVAFERNRIRARDMWVGYRAKDNWLFRFGNHKPAFSLAQVTTSRWYEFIEVPSVVEAFAPSRAIGLSSTYYNKSIFASVTVFGDENAVDGSDAVSDAEGNAEQFGLASRLIGRYHIGDDHIFHLGVNLADFGPQSEDNGEFEYDIEPESRIANYELIKTGDLENVDRIAVSGIEWLYKKGHWYVQAEYLQSTISFVDGKPDYESDGYYIQGSYFFRGKGRGYQLHDAEMEAVIPEDKRGDLEVALRFSQIDLNHISAGVFGGKSDSITLAFNWYVNRNIIFRFNYIDADFDEHADGNGDFNGNESLKIYAFRTQVLF